MHGAGLPAREVSQAINRLAGENVCRYVNGMRVQELRRLLMQQQDKTITTAMHEAGFVNRSNFSREFQGITGQTPVAWRNTGGNG
ncbi:helix-turn-helix domain-containing protein [Labrenzia sp. 011]|uniref:helix-turn-helix domain-containing protein n=1 Tax=Labrenzia sp. 011 TaxID=2171494 RepID=UPI000D521BED|nr:helix-turn-helix domain-containing protein [Labrenzia sp. 011]PVB59830.1 hypothetical protein DCO57_20290 [Labrenzia sp. 011]